MPYNFFKNKISFRFNNKALIINWLDKSIEKESCRPGDITFVFCSDKQILKINKKYLNHDYYTDIITFDYSNKKILSGDIFISIDTVKDNATRFNVSFNDELTRVMIHGVLHLIGYKDKSPSESKRMREKEDNYLSLLDRMKKRST